MQSTEAVLTKLSKTPELTPAPLQLSEFARGADLIFKHLFNMTQNFQSSSGDVMNMLTSQQQANTGVNNAYEHPSNHQAVMLPHP